MLDDLEWPSLETRREQSSLTFFYKIHSGVTVNLAPLDSLPPGGQDIPGYLAPHPGYLHPRGASCPSRFALPPPKNKKKSFLTFCYFSAKQQEFNILLQSFREKVMSDLHFSGINLLGASCSGRFILPPPKY